MKVTVDLKLSKEVLAALSDLGLEFKFKTDQKNITGYSGNTSDGLTVSFDADSNATATIEISGKPL